MQILIRCLILYPDLHGFVNVSNFGFPVKKGLKKIVIIKGDNIIDYHIVEIEILKKVAFLNYFLIHKDQPMR